MQHIIYKQFTSANGLIAHVTNDQLQKISYPKDELSSHSDDEKFSQTKSFEEAVSLMKNGWPKGRTGVHALMEKYSPVFATLLPKQDFASEVTHDKSGEAVDMGKFLQGDPDNMISFAPANKLAQGHKLQRIIVQRSVSCNVDEKTIFSYGAMTLAMCEALEGNGFRTEIIVRCTIGHKWRQDNTDIINFDYVLKGLDEDTDYDKYAYAMAHPAFFRRIIFRCLEFQAPEVCAKFGIPGGGYGYPANYNKDLRQDDLYIGTLYNSVMTDVDKLYKETFKPMIERHFGTIEGEFSGAM